MNKKYKILRLSALQGRKKIDLPEDPGDL